MRALVALAAGTVVLALAACGGGSSGKPGRQTVAVAKISGVGNVLVDAKGDALYAADQEAGGRIRCTGACTAVWIPLTLAKGTATPTAGSGVPGGKLGVVRRPDGRRQVTWTGKPLYHFAADGGPHRVTGNGAKDRFGGTSFTWHVAAIGTVTASTKPRGGYGY